MFLYKANLTSTGNFNTIQFGKLNMFKLLLSGNNPPPHLIQPNVDLHLLKK